MYNFCVEVFLVFLAASIAGVIGLLAYLLFLPLKTRLSKSGKLSKQFILKTNVVFVVSLSILWSGIFVFIYNDVFPGDTFYKEEFKFFTGIELPISADVKGKDATYPDFFGDFSALAIIELEKDDFIKLKQQVAHLKNFQQDTLSPKMNVKEEYAHLVEGVKDDDVEIVFFSYQYGRFRVAFLKDGKTIIFERITA